MLKIVNFIFIVGIFCAKGFPQGYNYQQQFQEPIETKITKHFFIHSAPDWPADIPDPKYITVGQPQKHYRVLFIKTPSQPRSPARIHINQAPNEEQTIIYVLSKKHEPIDIQTSIDEKPVQLSRPEVFFIKYKTPEEAAHAQQKIQDHYDSLGGSTHVSNEGISPITSVIGSVPESSPPKYIPPPNEYLPAVY